MITALLALVALAADEPTVHAQTRLAAAGWPSGAIWDNRVEIRTPLFRADSIVFRDTYAGAGLRVAATPAFTEVGPRFTFAPIDVFDVTVSAAWTGYYGAKGIGLLPFDAPRGKLESERSARGDEGVTGSAVSVTLEPTLKAKLGPVIGLHGWTISYLAIQSATEPTSQFVYEPFRDLVVGWNDWTFEHQSALLYEVFPGGTEPMLRVGATARDRWAVASKDHSTTVGLLVMGRPGTKWYVPTLMGQVLWYARDADRVGPIPSLTAVAQWEFERPLR